MEERANKIVEACMLETSKNPIEIFNNIAHKDFVRIHGPEHHVLDGAALLIAFYNPGGEIPLQESLVELMKRGLQKLWANTLVAMCSTLIHQEPKQNLKSIRMRSG